MSVPSEQHIQIKDSRSAIRFAWEEFDGDDCFLVHYIAVDTNGDSRRFDFGACVVRGLRTVSRFLSDETEHSATPGFRNPDIRTYDLVRTDDGFRLVIHFEESHQQFEYELKQPEVHVDTDFLLSYDAD